MGGRGAGGGGKGGGGDGSALTKKDFDGIVRHDSAVRSEVAKFSPTSEFSPTVNQTITVGKSTYTVIDVGSVADKRRLLNRFMDKGFKVNSIKGRNTIQVYAKGLK